MELIERPDEPIAKTRAWLLASRPKTLWAAFIPVVIGTVMAIVDGVEHWPSACVALFGALAIQVGTNFVNDYADFAQGADSPDRKGPLRVTQAGMLQPRIVLIGALVVFGLAVLSGTYLIARAGWPILVIGMLSIAAGYLYTAGPKPLGYLGLGDLFVLVFFGPVAVGGTYFVQALDVNPIVIISGFAPGLLSVALLSVNNLRDIKEDAAVGKRTLAVRFGASFARWEYVFCVVVAAAIPFGLSSFAGRSAWTLVCLATALAAAPIFRTLFAGTEGRSLVPLLGSTAKLSILYAVLFSVSWML